MGGGGGGRRRQNKVIVDYFGGGRQGYFYGICSDCVVAAVVPVDMVAVYENSGDGRASDMLRVSSTSIHIFAIYAWVIQSTGVALTESILLLAGGRGDVRISPVTPEEARL